MITKRVLLALGLLYFTNAQRLVEIYDKLSITD